MDLTEVYFEMMTFIRPVLIISGMVSLTLAMIVMLVNMLINAFCGNGFRIGGVR